ncbi:MAG: FtsQ-type POTRA domain-containing protein [Nocardioides sp.]
MQGLWRWVVTAVLVVGLLGTAIWLVWFSSAFALERVTVTGSDYLSADDVRSAAELKTGEPLARVDLAGVEGRVEALAPIRSATVTRSWPHEIRIQVFERTAVAVVRVGGRSAGWMPTG